MQGICSLPRTTLHCALLVFAVTFAGCTAWLPVNEPDELEPIVVTKTPPPDLGPFPEPQPEPVVQVPRTPTLAPVAIVLTSSQPVEVRPIARTLPSGNRIALPDLTPSKISILPLVNRASSSSSPSLMVMALIPFFLGREYDSSDVFLITPFLVARSM